MSYSFSTNSISKVVEEIKQSLAKEYKEKLDQEIEKLSKEAIEKFVVAASAVSFSIIRSAVDDSIEIRFFEPNEKKGE